MILIDSSVWIDYLRGSATSEVQLLDEMLKSTYDLAIGDLILTEVLQGCENSREFERAKFLLTSLPVIPLVGEDIAIQAAKYYMFLRSRGITVRKTIDTIIATKCIAEGHKLLHSDRDFDPFVTHLGLQVVV